MFAPTIRWAAGAAAGLRRLLGHAEAEFADPGGLASNPIALVAFVDLFIHTALRALPHNYSERLARPDHPAPVHLRRAEAYLAAHADAPLRLEDVATDAGCSIRALQRAFRHFRGTTPHAAIHAARLDRARAELARGGAPVAVIARRFGFSKPGRFIAAYTRRFGSPPPTGSPRA